jgi:hypothetical protein
MNLLSFTKSETVKYRNCISFKILIRCVKSMRLSALHKLSKKVCKDNFSNHFFMSEVWKMWRVPSPPPPIGAVYPFNKHDNYFGHCPFSFMSLLGAKTRLSN